ncbi:hypothetical protein [Streptomyces sp. B21-105]|uniref:hypothetical protein n=1 Tax=Streptomyces sp. B21-105 TaxID=3039417 RepID=UPI003FA7BEE4
MLVVLSGVLVLPGQLAAAAPAEADSASLTEVQQALAEAEDSGQRVEVAGERTDRTTTFANPDGFTLTLEQSVVPVRVSKPGGGWQAPNATLEKRSDGSVGPKAAAVSIAFSAGGDKAPLARIAGEGTSLELQWPGKLPAPRLDGAKAVYDDVLPDVDLQVTATPESFQPVFVVKTPEAAANEEIATTARALRSKNYAGVELVADWSADKGVGTTIADTASGFGQSLALSGGASLDGESIVADGVDDAATTAGPVVDDTSSFTVTALAAVDGAKLLDKQAGYTGQVLGQRTSDGSAWGFWYELTDKVTVFDEEAGEEKTVPKGFWRFGRLNADGIFSAVASEDNALLDGMVRMTGVANAQDGTIGLYLGAVPNGEEQAFSAKIGTGDFAVGKGFSGNAWKHYLPGGVAEVRLWAGAMAGFEQVEQTIGD